MARVPLTLACGAYDRTRALLDGAVQPEGIDLNYIPLRTEEVLWRMAYHQEFDAAEMTLSGYLIGKDRGDSPFIAIPVFPSRCFRHSFIFINRDAGIDSPEELRGKRMGVPEYEMTAAVWLRGLFQHEYGVAPEEIFWYTGGQEQPGRRERVPFKAPAGVSLQRIPENKTLNAMLEAGEIDAFMGARILSSYAEGSPAVRRLFPDYQRVEMDYYRRTGIFPMMHVVVIKEEICRRHPWVAQSLYKAFCQAQELCIQNMHESGSLQYTLPWLFAMLEELEELFGKDWWPSGVEANRVALEALTQYMQEQGMTQRKLEVNSLFAPSTLEEFRI